MVFLFDSIQARDYTPKKFIPAQCVLHCVLCSELIAVVFNR